MRTSAEKEARPRYQREPRAVKAKPSLAHIAKTALAAAAVLALSAGMLYSFSLIVFVNRFGVVPW